MVVIAVAAAFAAVAAPVQAAPPTQTGIFPESLAPATQVDPDRASVELGVRFVSAQAGTVRALQFYRSEQQTGSYVGTLWSGRGSALATATFPASDIAGWQTAPLSSPVRLMPNRTYVASYLAPQGAYAVTEHALFQPYRSNGFTVPANGGVYVYGGGFPRYSYAGSNYLVDVVFAPDADTASPTPTASTTTPTASPTTPTPTPTTPTPTPTTPTPTPTTPTPTPTATPSGMSSQTGGSSNPAAGGGSGSASSSPTPTSASASGGVTTPSSPQLALTDVDGGLGYYGAFSRNTLPTSSSFFPIGVWMEQYTSATRLSGYGVNMIVNPVGTAAATGSVYTVGALDDEVDMWGGPGSAAWTGNYPGQGPICSPSTAACGFTIMASHSASSPPGAMRYANYGKGVEFWDNDADAARFVNAYQDVVSADLYWGTDADLCQASQGGTLLGTGRDLSATACHQASNYGDTVRRIRSLVSPAGSKPVWNYVELGHPGTSGGQMPVAEIKAAVWSSLIAGARGIVYFNHSFGGNCQTQHVLFDCDPSISSTVTAINAQITSLAPVLNSPTVTSGATVAGVDGIVKWDGTNLYVFAQGSGTGSVSIACTGNATATVLGENRTIPIVGGQFTDTFADSNAVHLYRIDGGSTCGL